MDIQETNKLNKTESSIDSSIIRTMAKDMAGLKGKRSFVSKAAPPAGLPVLPITPLKPPISPKPKIPEIKIIGKQRKPAFIFLALTVVIIISSIGGFFYWWNYVRLVPEIVIEEEVDEPIIVELHEPSSFISVATTETIELIAGQENLLIGQLKALSVQEQEDNTFKRVLVKITDQSEIKYADLSALMIALGINIPEPITAAITQELNNYTLFFYSQPEGNRLGLIIKIEGSETLVQDLKDWETTALDDIKSMLLIDKIPFAATEGFQDNIYKGIYIRYTNFATPDLSLDYSLVAGNLVLSTSRESMFATIDALENNGISENISVEANMDIVSSCGGIECFKERFTNCESTTMESTLNESLVYYYEIFGPKDNLCEVKSKFLANPNPDWIGKEMVCQYDNSLDFEMAIVDMENCQGELYDLMRSY